MSTARRRKGRPRGRPFAAGNPWRFQHQEQVPFAAPFGTPRPGCRRTTTRGDPGRTDPLGYPIEPEPVARRYDPESEPEVAIMEEILRKLAVHAIRLEGGALGGPRTGPFAIDRDELRLKWLWRRRDRSAAALAVADLDPGRAAFFFDMAKGRRIGLAVLKPGIHQACAIWEVLRQAAAAVDWGRCRRDG